MTERMYRAQILLEPEQHKALAAIAERKGTSISQVVREIVGQYLVGQDTELEKRLAALDKLRELGDEILTRRGGQPLDVDVAALIEEMRDERDREIWEAAFGNCGGCEPDDQNAAAQHQ